MLYDYFLYPRMYYMHEFRIGSHDRHSLKRANNDYKKLCKDSQVKEVLDLHISLSSYKMTDEERYVYELYRDKFEVLLPDLEILF